MTQVCRVGWRVLGRIRGRVSSVKSCGIRADENGGLLVWIVLRGVVVHGEGDTPGKSVEVQLQLLDEAVHDVHHVDAIDHDEDGHDAPERTGVARTEVDNQGYQVNAEKDEFDD